MDKLVIFVGYFCVVFLLLHLSYGDVALPDEIKQEIQNHKADVQRIIDYVLSGAGKHAAIKRLAYITDTWGPRATGSDALAEAIEFAVSNLTKEQGIENVDKEPVKANYWKRNKESAKMIEPRIKDLNMLSLGSSVGTNGLLTAEVIVVQTFEEMDKLSKENAGIFTDKIVVYNMEWAGYRATVPYRSTGAYRAAVHGAKAALLRSVTNFGIYTPHTGIQMYNDSDQSVAKIPVAAITIEDAQMLQRIYDRGVTIKVELHMTCENLGTIETHNVVAEVVGDTMPDEVVIIGGHIDSWDVGNGVMDDGGGVMISWQALLNLVALGLTPKRTIRAVFWTAEEIGLIGAFKYFDVHKVDHEKVSLVMESDYGTFKPFGVGFSGTESARGIMEEILSLLEPINATGVGPSGNSPDTGMWIKAGVPGSNLWTANDKYFYYHHSDGDSITMEDPDDLDLGLIVWTVVSYVVANLEQKLPRTEIYLTETSSGTSRGNTYGDVNFTVVVTFINLLLLITGIKFVHE